MNTLKEMFKIADTHVRKIDLAFEALKSVVPFDQKKVLDLSIQDSLWVELLISRFAKLQDFIGKKMIDQFLKMTKDYSDNMTMLEKLNQLKRLEIIPSVDVWEQMREARNHIAHEDPDEPALTAKYLNQIFEFTPQLIEILNHIKYRSG